jgi:uncharacterized membrane protein YcaP (DUF421 family)
VSEVERCFLEPDGKLSVLKRDKQKDGKPKQDKAQPAGARA